LKKLFPFLVLFVLHASIVYSQSKSKYPFLKAKQPTYVTSDKYTVEKVKFDTNDYQYRAKYFFPTLNTYLTVTSSLNTNSTGILLKQGNKLIGNKAFQFVSQIEDLPPTIEAADLDNDGNIDFIVRLQNHIGPSLARQVHTTMYMFKKPKLYSYMGMVTVSFFGWKEYDTNDDKIYEMPCMDLVGIQQENMYSLNMFQFKNGAFENIGGEKLPYPRFYKYQVGDTLLPTKTRKVKTETKKYYITSRPMISYHE